MRVTKNLVGTWLKLSGIKVEEGQAEALKREINEEFRRAEYEQLLFVEDGSITEKDINNLKKHNPEIKVVKYRQGSVMPQLKEI